MKAPSGYKALENPTNGLTVFGFYTKETTPSIKGTIRNIFNNAISIRPTRGGLWNCNKKSDGTWGADNSAGLLCIKQTNWREELT